MEKASPRLPAHEWAAVITFITILTFIAILNFFVNKRDAHLTLPIHSTDEVHITFKGAVSTPKTFKVKQGTKLSEVIEKVGVREGADLSSLQMGRALKNDQVIDIPAKKMITVFLEGDVSFRGAFIIDAGSTLNDLYDKLQKEQPITNRGLAHEEVLKF